MGECMGIQALTLSGRYGGDALKERAAELRICHVHEGREAHEVGIGLTFTQRLAVLQVVERGA